MSVPAQKSAPAPLRIDRAQVAPRRDVGEDFAEAFEHRARQRVALRRAFEPDEEKRAPLTGCDFDVQGAQTRFIGTGFFGSA